MLDPDVAREAVGGAAPGVGAGRRGSLRTLTDREKQVLRLVAEGHSNKEIAEILGISVKTAMSHREHVMEKLDLHSRTDLIVRAQAGGHPGTDRPLTGLMARP